MKFLDACEQALTSALEKIPLALLRSRVEPVHIARELERSLEQHRLIGPQGPIVPHRFLVKLHASDFDRFADQSQSIARELARDASRHADRRGWRMLESPQVSIVSDAAVSRGRIAITVQHDALEEHGAAAQISTDTPVRLPATMKLPVTPMTRAVRLTLPSGGTLDKHGERLTVGRGDNNDFVIEHPQVSRRHAELRWNGDHYDLVDLESTNGLWLAGKRVQSIPLPALATVGLGGAEVTIQTL